jgi:hypothetical protein
MASGGKGKRTEERIPVGGAMAYIHNEGYNVINWSRHGIVIGPYVGSLRAGDPFTFQFVVPMSDGEKFSFSVWANVVRVDGHGLAARYVDLNDRVSNMIGKMLDMLMVPQ